MNFTNFYQNEETIEEGPVADIANSNVGTVAKAAAKGVGRGIANVVRGALGRTKTMAFEPNWLKALKPIDYQTYKQTQNFYVNAKAKQTKLGPKKNFTVKDLRDGVLGDLSGGEAEPDKKKNFIEQLKKYDPAISKVNLDAKIKPVISIYLLNNGGKVIFFQLPVGKDGKQKLFAMGLDNKAERAFRLIHGITFADYSLNSKDEYKPEEKEKKTTQVQQKPLNKFVVPKTEFKKLVPNQQVPPGGIKITPPKPAMQNASTDFSLFNLFSEMVLDEADGKLKVGIVKGKLWNLDSDEKFDPVEFKHIHGDDYAKKLEFANTDAETLVKTQISDHEEPKEKSKEAPKNTPEIDPETKEEVQPEDNTEETNTDDTNTEQTSEEPNTDDVKKYGLIYAEQDVKDNLVSILTARASDKAEAGFVYKLKNGGKIYLYKGKGQEKYYIAFDPLAEKVVNIDNLINKYKLERSDEQPEENAAESVIYVKNVLKETYHNKSNYLMDLLDYSGE